MPSSAPATVLQPGHDVALTGFDGLDLPVDLEPPLTSVRIPMEAVAAELVAMLLPQVDGGSTPEAPLLVPTELVLGGTA